jgi:hypothetical protein
MRRILLTLFVALSIPACTGAPSAKEASEDTSWGMTPRYNQCSCDEDEVAVPTVCPTPSHAEVPASQESPIYAKLTRSFKPGAGHWASSRMAPAGYHAEGSWYLLKDGDCEAQQLLWECSALGHTNYLSHGKECTEGSSQVAAGYVYRRPVPGSVALYQCLVHGHSDFFVSPRSDCEGQETLGLLGHAMPSPVDPPPQATGSSSCTCPDAGAPGADAGGNPSDAGNPNDPGSPGGQCPPDEDNGPLRGLPYPEVDARGVKGIVYSPGDPNQRIPMLKGAGTKLVGYNIPWFVVEPTRRSAPCGGGEFQYDGYCYRDVVGNQIKSLNDAGMRVTAVLYGVPEWARTGNTKCSPLNDTFRMFCAPDNPDDFARFAGMLAQRYDGQSGRGRIHSFVIHNEVNSNIWFDIGCGSGTPCNTDAWISAYADNYNRAYDRIKMHQSEAKVLVSLTHHLGEGTQDLSAEYPLVAGANFLRGFAERVGARNWQVAFHPYPKDLLKVEFSALDWPHVTYGNPGRVVGWLRQTFPNDPHAWKVQFTESGINSAGPNSSEAAQAIGVCDSNYNVLGTPWVTDYIYHGMFDDGLMSDLQVGLFRADGGEKPAWGVWANQNGCGYQHLPYTRLVRSYRSGGAHWASSRRPPAGYAEEKAWYLERNGDCATQQILWECNVDNRTAYLSKEPTCPGAMNMGPVGYASLTQQSGMVSLYQCKVNDSDLFVSDDANCEGQSKVGFLGYVRTNP